MERGGGAWERAAPRALYVHIPFCTSKCYYCDFNSYVSGPQVRGNYVRALRREISMLREAHFPGGDRPELDTVFFGGGTPTVLTEEEFQDLALAIRSAFRLARGYEWTVEANPGSADPGKLRAFREAGANRISFGAQTFNETLLLAIGRTHGAGDVERSVAFAREAGFGRISLDLMLGLPDQTGADVREGVRRARDTGVGHISVYGLKVEEGTPFAVWESRGHLRLPDEDLQADMYEQARSDLEEAGFSQYEISNFARPGEESNHNLGYWRNLPYLGAGAGAHGFVSGIRYENRKSLSDYAKDLEANRLPVAGSRRISGCEAMEDAMILGLRTREGVAAELFRARYGRAPRDVFGPEVEFLVRQGALRDEGGRLNVPRELFGVANEVFERFVGACANRPANREDADGSGSGELTLAGPFGTF